MTLGRFLVGGFAATLALAFEFVAPNNNGSFFRRVVVTERRAAAILSGRFVVVDDNLCVTFGID